MIGAVLRETLGLYGALASRLVPVAALVFAPFAVALLGLELAAPARPERELDLAIIDAVGAVLLFAPLVSIATIRCAIAHEAGQRPQPLREAGRAFDLLVAYVLTQLLVLALIVLLPGLMIAGGAALGLPLLTAVGFGALIASAIVNGTRLAVATPAVVVDGIRFGAALRRSSALVRGRFLATLAVLALVALMAIAIGLVLSAGAAALPDGATRAIMGALLGVVANALTVPLGALAAYRLYRALAERQAATAPSA